jgi:hypothetical protein
VKSARAKYTSRLSHTIRIGHRAAFHMGAWSGERAGPCGVTSSSTGARTAAPVGCGG